MVKDLKAILTRVVAGDISEDEAVKLLAASDTPACAPPQGEAEPSNPPEARARVLSDGSRALLIDDIKKIAGELLKIPPAEIGLRQPIADYGLNSVIAAELIQALENRFGIRLTPTVFFEHDNLESLVGYLLDQFGKNISRVQGERPQGDGPGARDISERLARPSSGGTFIDGGQASTGGEPERAKTFDEQLEDLWASTSVSRDSSGAARATTTSQARQSFDKDDNTSVTELDGGVAIIGIAGILPGSPDLRKFWKNLERAQDLVGELPRSRVIEGSYEQAPTGEGLRSDIKLGGFLDSVAGFDAEFFGISPREASLMDPQQRLMLQTVWHAIEDAGYRASELSGTRTGLYIGVATTDYQDMVVERGLPSDAYMATGLAHSILANRLSWLLNLKGPSEPLNNSCATSLMAVHHAVAAIRNGDCEMAIVGGVNLILHSRVSDSFRRVGTLSPTGRCRPFSDGADGFVRGEGVGALLLKPFGKALKDGDQIYAVVRGAAFGHSGRSTTLTAPNLDAWVDVIVRAHRSAGIDPATTSYIEAYGIGADLVDQVEVLALKKAFHTLGASPSRCGIGSVKGNVGSLETASGMAALFKVLLSMRNGKLPPTLHVNQLNPHLNLSGSPFYIVKELQSWDRPRVAGKEVPRRAGISAFSFGGSNAHLVIEEYAASPSQAPSTGSALFVLSARNADSLRATAETLAAALEEQIDSGLAPSAEQVAYTLQVGREAWEHRLALVAQGLSELIRKLRQWLDHPNECSEVFTGVVPTRTALAQRATDMDFSSHGVAGPGQGLVALAERWVKGEYVDWNGLYDRPAGRVSLPGYAFRQKSFWLRAGKEENISADSVEAGLAQAADRAAPDEPAPLADNQRPIPSLIPDILDPRSDWVQVSRETYGGQLEELERRSQYLILGAFQRMGVFQNPGEQHDLSALSFRLGIAGSAQAVFHKLLKVLQAAGYVRESANAIAATSLVKRPSAWQSLQALEPQIRLAEACADKLPEFLRGEISAPEILFPASSTDLVEAVYADNSLTEPFNDAIARLVNAYVERVAAGKRGDEKVRVLEVGAGTGGTSQRVWRLMGPHAERIDYRYTDVSPVLVRRARKRYAQEAPFTSFQVFDLEKEPVAQGFESASFDLVIASNVLHTTRDLKVTLGNIGKLLKPAGWLILNEVAPGRAFLDLTFGLLDGWGRFNDERRLKGSPLLTASEWKRWLKDTGFGETRVYGDSPVVEQASQNVIVAERLASACTLEQAEMKTAIQPVVAADSLRDTGRAAAGLEGEGFQYVLDRLSGLICESLEIPREDLDINLPFSSYGLDSILGVELIGKIESMLGVKVRATALYNHSTVLELAQYIEQEFGEAVMRRAVSKAEPVGDRPPSEAFTRTDSITVSSRHSAGADIAVIGMAGRFADASNLDEFWNNLTLGKCSIRPVPPARWSAEQYYDPDPRQLEKTYCVEGGFLENIDLFDADFFGMTGKEAELTDPQHRLFLEEAWAALEQAGYATRDTSGARCGVFVGAGGGDYLTEMLRVGAEKGAQSFWGNTASVMASRVSYFLNLKGASMAVDTACSSSLVAVHLACQSLLSGENDLVIAGGVFISVMPTFHVLASNGRMLSPTGRCRTFDQGADGFVPGEGVGAVVLKRLDDAVRDRDQIHAVIKGTGINQDGRTNGITAPSATSQRDLELAVYNKFGIDPGTITYVEAHGTGTKLGDPIEIEALTDSFKAYTSRKQYCAIGSVKTNIGHTATAAGIAGLLKAILAIKHRQIPPSLHFQQRNEHIDFDNSPFFVNTQAQDWNPAVRRAAISSFGFGGTNAHVVIEEPPPRQDVGANPAAPYHIFAFSARDRAALRESVTRFYDWLCSEGSSHSVEDIAFTLQVGRMHFSSRVALIAKDLDSLRGLIKDYLDGKQAGDVFDSSSADQTRERKALKELLAGLMRELGAARLSEEEYRDKLGTVADLYVSGYWPDWSRLYAKPLRRVPLPTYPFQRRRYWLEPGASTVDWATTQGDVAELAAGRATASTLYFTPAWLARPLLETDGGNPSSPILIFDRSDEVATAIRSRGHRVVRAGCADTFRNEGRDGWQVDARQPDHLSRLLEVLEDGGVFPQSVLFLTSLRRPQPAIDPAAEVSRAADEIIRPVQSLVRALLKGYSKRELQVLYLYEGAEHAPHLDEAVAASVAGFSRSARTLLPRLRIRVVRLPSGLSAYPAADIILRELSAKGSAYAEECDYAPDGSRLVKTWKEIPEAAFDNRARREALDGAWVITGGLGELGSHVARHLARNSGVKLALIGRSPLDGEARVRLEQIARSALYVQADVTDHAQLAAALQQVREAQGPIRGIVHAAGTITARILPEKTIEEFDAVLAAKLLGTVLLDALTAADPLDRFIVFSSAASVLGDFGQCDYAVANRFMDAFVAYREKLRGLGQRRGQAVSINWPLWNGSGMRFGTEREKAYEEATGIQLLDPQSGVQAFERLLHAPVSQVMLLTGREDRIRATLSGLILEASEIPAPAPVEQRAPALTSSVTPEQVAEDLRQYVADLFRIETGRISIDENLGALGLDSVMVTELAEKLTSRFGVRLDPTIFFNRPDLRSFAAYLLETHPDAMQRLYAAPPAPEPPPALGGTQAGREQAARQERYGEPQAGGQMAVVGMSGVFPQSEDTAKLWEHLAANRCLISEVPKERWDWQEVRGRDGEARARWLGAIANVDRFDARFFKMAPIDCELMDPQQRLFLAHSWNAIEHAGYRAGDLKGQRIGVFVGAQFTDYQELLMERGFKQPQAVTGNAHTMIANRVSYFFDFHGPSEVINTACSSSLVALHRAVMSIRAGICDSALVGGVSLILSASNLIGAAELGVLSPDGRCKTLDADANGYVKGEGVGVVFIKPLEKALSDRDYIHGVIRGVAVAHGGRANSLTAPNSEAQAALIIDACNDAGVSPAELSYIEMHGTGTRLGDPVEIEGLKQAFERMANEQRVDLSNAYCGLGSVKTNIGHLEPAAGIAGIIKTILSMQHGLLPGNPNFKELNPYLRIDGTPFYVVRETTAWARLKDGYGNELPRRAGVSSFGFGGSIAHVVLEEAPHVSRDISDSTGGPHLLILSAADEERLSAYARSVLEFLLKRREGQNVEGFSLRNFTYTLQTGREPLSARLAVLATDLDEAIELLRLVVDGRTHRAIFRGEASPFTAQPALPQHPGQASAAAMDYSEIARQWVSGATINWSSLYSGQPAWRVPAPTYPFKQTRYWFNSFESVDLESTGDQLRQALPGAQVGGPAPSAAPRQGYEQPGRLDSPDELRKWAESAAAYQGDEIALTFPQRGIAQVSMRDLSHGNMFSEQLVRGLLAAFWRIRQDPEVKAVVLTNDGPNFAMGGTRQALLDMADGKLLYTDLPFLYEGLLRCKVPVIAAIRGNAAGAGLVFGLYADIIVMAQESAYSANFMDFGITPGLGATYILGEKLGRQLANEMMFTARPYTGADLKRRGAPLVFTPRERTLDEAISIAQSLADKPRKSLELLKQELAEPILAKLPEVIAAEVSVQQESFRQADFRSRLDERFGKRAEAKEAAKTKEVAKTSATSSAASAGAGDAPLPQVSTAAEPANEPVRVRLAPRTLTTPFEPEPLEMPKIKLRPKHAVAQAVEVKSQQGSLEHASTAQPISSAKATSHSVIKISEQSVVSKVLEILQKRLKLKADEIPLDVAFSELGVDSINGIEMMRDLNAEFRLDLDASVLYDSPNVRQLARRIASEDRHHADEPGPPTHVEPAGADINRPTEDRSELQAAIARIICKAIHLNASDVDWRETFNDLGVDSISGVEITRELNTSFGLNLDAIVLYDHPTLAALTNRINEERARTGIKPLTPRQDPAGQRTAPGSGSQDRASEQAPAEGGSRPADSKPPASADHGQVLDHLIQMVGGILNLSRDGIAASTGFSELGIDSVVGVQIVREANRIFNVNLDATALYDYPTIADLAAAVESARSAVSGDKPPQSDARQADERRPRSLAQSSPDGRAGSPPLRPGMSVQPEPAAHFSAHGSDMQAIAVVGMSGRFPGAGNVADFWANLAAGVSSITEVPPERGWDVGSFFDSDPKAPGKSYSKWGGFLKDIDQFDPAFFNISRREAEIISPEQRLFLMECWKALEDAGYSDLRVAGTRCGVFVGANTGDYPKIVGNRYSSHALTGLSTCVLASRISYFLNLRGPSIAIDTACSSSLVAIHQACQSIIFGECDMALAGGVSLMLTPDMLILASKAGMLSATGRCSAFDASADGIVLGEAVGILVLKPLEKAIAERDHIYGVIRSIGVNQDGKTNGISAPSSQAQAALEERVYRRAGIDPAQITYVETHGTGTPLGDPIEFKALKKVLTSGGGRTSPCALGSVKTNVGHTNTAAGVVGAIKVLLSFQHKQLAPSLHYQTPNPHIALSEDEFRINTALREWHTAQGQRRIAALSSFGFSGTNAHAVLEEPPEIERGKCERPAYFIPISAKTREAHDGRVHELAEWLRHNQGISLADVSYTLCAGRSHFPVRSAFVVRDLQELQAGLAAYERGEKCEAHRFGVVTGQAAGVDTARGDEIPSAADTAAYRAALLEWADLYVRGAELEFDALFKGADVRKVPMPVYPFAKERFWIGPPDAARFDAAPSSTAPHPLLDGPDLSASLRDGLAFTKFIRPVESVVAHHKVLGNPIFPGVGYLEAAWAAASAVRTGAVKALSEVRWLQPMEVFGEGINYRLVLHDEGDVLRFEVSTDNLEPVVHARGKIEIGAQETQFEPAASIADIQARCNRRREAADIYRRYSEVGVDYGPYFKTLRQVWGNETEALGEVVLPPEASAQLASYTLHPALMDGALQAIAGFVVAAEEEELLLPFAVDRVELFEPLTALVYVHLQRTEGRQFDVRLLNESGKLLVKLSGVTLLPWRDPLRGMFYAPRWIEQTLAPLPVETQCASVLVIAPSDRLALDDTISELHRPATISTVLLGESFRQLGPRTWEIDAADQTAMDTVLERILDDAGLDAVYHFGAIETEETNSEEALTVSQHRGVLSLFRLVKALDKRGFRRKPLSIRVATNDVHGLGDTQGIPPFAAALHGFAKALAQEFKSWHVCCLDLSLSDLDEPLSNESRLRWLRPVAVEPRASGGRDVAVRRGRRYVRELEAIELSPGKGEVFRREGVYIILGGAGGIGYQLSLHLSAEYKARLIWIGRRAMDDQIKSQARTVERLGGRVLYLSADASDRQQLTDAVNRARSQYGEIHGAVHSALVLLDRTLQNMDEETLMAVLKPKAQGAVNLYDVMADCPLDFMMFFSSAQSFAGTTGQSNYAAACCFEDAYASYIRGKARFPVHTINWGYWGTVGRVANKDIAERMAGVGIHSIRPAEGIQAIHRILHHPPDQTLAIRAEADTRRNLGLISADHPTTSHAAQSSPSVEQLPAITQSALAAHQRASRALNRLSGWMLVERLGGMGLFQLIGTGISIAALKQALGVSTKYERLWAALLDILSRRRVIVIDGEIIRPSKWVNNGKVSSLLARLEDFRSQALKNFPALEPHINLLGHCLNHYSAVLSGRENAVEVLFPRGTFDLVAGLYRGNTVTDYFNRLTAAVIKQEVLRRIQDRAVQTVNVVEVGAGTGGTSAFVLEALADLGPRVRYVYSDISKHFVEHGKAQFGKRFGFAEFVVLDIDHLGHGELIAPHSIDIIFGTSVLHASRDLSATLRRLRRLLAPNGLVVINESTEIQDFATITFGLTDGWWTFEDAAMRLPHSPLVTEAGWKRLLEENGFKGAAVYRPPAPPELLPAQAVFAARYDGLKDVADAGENGARREVKRGRADAFEKHYFEARANEHNGPDTFNALVNEYVRAVLGEVLKADPATFNDDATFETYGVDSLISQEINGRFEADLGSLPATMLFENASVAALTSYLVATRREALERHLGIEKAAPAAGPAGHGSSEGAPLNGRRNGSSPPSSSVSSHGDGQALREEIYQLSDSEVDALLTRLLQKD